MVGNYIKVSYRNLIKHKGYALINILGLAIGLACSLLILLYLTAELRYDEFHEKSDRIFRLTQTMESESRIDRGATTPFRAGPTLEAEYPHLIEHSVRLFNLQVPKLSVGVREQRRFYKEQNFFFADSAIFDVFTIDLVRGNPQEALSAPQSIVISEPVARKYFGDSDPIGKELNFEGRISLTVTGVMKSLPQYSHLRLDLLASFNTLDQFYRSAYDVSWYWNPCWTYLLLADAADAKELRGQLSNFADKYYHPNLPESDRVELALQPLTDIHLYSSLDQEIQVNGNIQYVYIFSVAAILILFIAAINFMNLATARSAGRSREIGMRKALGDYRWRLFGQFMSEAYLMCLLAFMIALGLVYLFLPYYSAMLDVKLNFGLFANGSILAGVLVLFLILGGLAGGYPAAFLSKLSPVKSLRGEYVTSKKGERLRKLLVVTQFTFSILLIIGTVFVYQQLNLLRERNMGFDRDQVVIIPADLTRTIWYYEEYKERLLSNAYIHGVTGSKNVLGSPTNTYHKYRPEGYSDPVSIPAIFVMHDFVELYGIEMLAGRTFSKEYTTDRTRAIILNEQAVTEFGWEDPEQAVGRRIFHNGQEHQVVGVSGNFNHTSLRRPLEPLVLDMPDEEYDVVSDIHYIAVKIDGQNIEPALDHIRTVWNEIDATHPFEFFFHDQRLEQIYRQEAMMAHVVTAFSILATIVACLGLLGLASYTAERRTREIGIRKAMGATSLNIVGLLTKDYLMLVTIANLFAWPLAYIIAHRWLENFPYRIELGLNALGVFIGAGLIAALVIMATVSYQALKCARVEPAKTIRDH